MERGEVKGMQVIFCKGRFITPSGIQRGQLEGNQVVIAVYNNGAQQVSCGYLTEEGRCDIRSTDTTQALPKCPYLNPLIGEIPKNLNLIDRDSNVPS